MGRISGWSSWEKRFHFHMLNKTCDWRSQAPGFCPFIYSVGEKAISQPGSISHSQA